MNRRTQPEKFQSGQVLDIIVYHLDIISRILNLHTAILKCFASNKNSVQNPQSHRQLHPRPSPPPTHNAYLAYASAPLVAVFGVVGSSNSLLTCNSCFCCPLP